MDVYIYIYIIYISTKSKSFGVQLIHPKLNLNFHCHPFLERFENYTVKSFEVSPNMKKFWLSHLINLPRNEDAAKHDRLLGAKHQAVKAVLSLPEASRDQILATVSLWGWDSFLPDKSLRKSTGWNFLHGWIFIQEKNLSLPCSAFSFPSLVII